MVAHSRHPHNLNTPRRFPFSSVLVFWESDSLQTVTILAISHIEWHIVRAYTGCVARTTHSFKNMWPANTTWNNIETLTCMQHTVRNFSEDRGQCWDKSVCKIWSKYTMRFKSYEPAEMMLSKPISIKKGCYTCQWLHNVDMHLYAKCDRNIPCSSRVMSTDVQTIRLT